MFYTLFECPNLELFKANQNCVWCNYRGYHCFTIITEIIWQLFYKFRILQKIILQKMWHGYCEFLGVEKYLPILESNWCLFFADINKFYLRQKLWMLIWKVHVSFFLHHPLWIKYFHYRAIVRNLNHRCHKLTVSKFHRCKATVNKKFLKNSQMPLYRNWKISHVPSIHGTGSKEGPALD